MENTEVSENKEVPIQEPLYEVCIHLQGTSIDFLVDKMKVQSIEDIIHNHFQSGIGHVLVIPEIATVKTDCITAMSWKLHAHKPNAPSVTEEFFRKGIEIMDSHMKRSKEGEEWKEGE